MDKFKVMQDVVIDHIRKSNEMTTLLKVEIFSYLFFQLCWDFDYYSIIGDFESCS